MISGGESATDVGLPSELKKELEQIDAELQRLIHLRAQRIKEHLFLANQAPASENPAPDAPPTASVLSTVLTAGGATGGSQNQLEEQYKQDAVLLQSLNSGSPMGLDVSAMQRVFTSILSECRMQPLTVGYLGPAGTFTQAATFKHFGQNVQSVPFSTIDDVFRSVETGECHFGVVPLENSIEGMINRTLDRISESTLHVCGEVRLRIKHNLMTLAASAKDIKSVHAHPQALAQCRLWMDSNLPGVPRQNASSNAAAAQLAMEDSSVAAIAGDIAAELYQLPVLHEHIEDEASNTTRFMVIGQTEIPPTGEDSTLVMVSAPHRPGGLRKMLEPFENAGVSMTRIESRPSKTAIWNYVFFIDVSGHKDDGDLAPALEALSKETRYFRVLGSYPQALT